MTSSPIRIGILLLTLLSCGSIYSQTWNNLSDASIPRWLPHGLLDNDKLFVLSGFVEYEVIIPSFEVYDIPTDTWTTLTPMPISKYESDTTEAGVTHMASILIDHTIWVFGGRAGTHPGPVTEEVWIYDIATDTWAPGPDLPKELSSGYCVNAGRTFHYVGGFFNACNGLQDSYHFTLDFDDWLADPSTSWENNRKPLPRPRSHVSVAHMAGKIYVFGGEHGHDYCYSDQPQQGIDLTEVDVYDIETDIWTILPDLPYARSHAEGMTFPLDGRIYQVGSEVSATTSETTLMYDPDLGIWIELPDWEFPETIMAPAVGVYRDSLYITHGGYPGRNDPKSFTKYKTITRSPVYELGWNADTLDFWVYAGLPADQKTFLWTKTGSIRADLELESPATWLSFADSVDLDIAGIRTNIAVNSTGLASGTYFANVILQGSAPDVVDPSITAVYTSDTLVVRLTVGPSPDGILLLDQSDLCEKIEVGNSITFPLDILTPGAASISLSSSSFSNASNFALMGSLPSLLAANAHDSIYVTFTPDSAGPFSSVFTVNHLGTGNSTDILLTCDAIPPCELPTDWVEVPLGTPNLIGSACVTGDTYRMTAAGNNIWSGDDEGHFLATQVSGDGEMILKVNWVTEQNDDDAKVGIMFRESLDEDAKNAFICLNPEKAIKFQYRDNTGNGTQKVENKGFYPPHWMRLTRVGNTFTAYHSEDGVTWSLVNDGKNPQTFAMNDTIYAGIAFTSHDVNNLSEAEIQFVSVNFNNVVFPVQLAGFDAELKDRDVQLRWEAASEENFSHYEIQRKSLTSETYEPLAMIPGAGLPVYLAWDHDPLIGMNTYRLVMHDVDGGIAYSDQVAISFEPSQVLSIRKSPGIQAIELAWSGQSTESTVTLMDITGREVMQKSQELQAGQSHLVNIPGLSSGYYLVEVKWNGKAVRKLVRIEE